MIPQTKGKDYKKLPTSYTSLIDDKLFYTSIKYDGHYGQIHIQNDSVRFFTSGGKEFYVEPLGTALKKLGIDVILEYEYIHNTEGKLGDRGKAAKITTYRTEFAKGKVSTLDPKARFMIHDIIRYEVSFKYRVESLLGAVETVLQEAKVPNIEVVKHHLLNMEASQEFADDMVKLGYEGAMCKEVNQVFTPITRTKRVNNIIKLKPRLTADLVCIGINSGEGKYIDMIGSLILSDDEGREVSVGSGLTDEQRLLPDNYFIDKVIEIEYERIDDTYIQPIFKFIRDDK